MFRCFHIILFTIAVICGNAQFDLGLAAGHTWNELRVESSPHFRLSYADRAIPASLTFFYRERKSARVSFATEFQFTRYHWAMDLSTGGLGGGRSDDLALELYFLHWGVLPELRLDPRGDLRIRFGPQIGWLLGGAAAGTYRTWSVVGDHSFGEVDESAIVRKFKGDIRLLIGIGYRLRLNERWSIHLDPYVSMGMGKIHLQPDMWLYQAGLKIGLAFAFPNTGLWQALREGAPQAAPVSE